MHRRCENELGSRVRENDGFMADAPKTVIRVRARIQFLCAEIVLDFDQYRPHHKIIFGALGKKPCFSSP